MTYQEMLSHLYARARFGARPGHERVLQLLSRLGDPHLRLRAIHVIGTNGKGSTTAFLESVLRASAITTGRFTSPHLVSFTERFRINGADIGDDELLVIARRVLEAAPPEATFFELATAMAILCFREAGVDLAILEAGMGGRSDATTAVPGFMTLLTPISLDHGQYLGSTVADIAAEKAGDLRPGQVVIVGPQPDEAMKVIDGICRRQGVSPRRWGAGFHARWDGGTLAYRGGAFSANGLNVGIGGLYQRENAAVALAAAEELARLGYGITPAAVQSGLAAARWPGRMELFPGSPDLLLDGAHNPAAAAALAQSLAAMGRRCRLVLGAMEDKDLSGLLAPLASLASALYAVVPAMDRAVPAQRIVDCSRSLSLPAIPCGSVAEGIDAARREATADELIVVCGSLFVVGEARALLIGGHYQPVRG